VALIAQPFRHPDSGIYYFRRAVPEDLRPTIGKVEIRRSLKTRDHRLAKAAFAAAYTESEQLFQQARLTVQDPTQLVAMKQPARPVASLGQPALKLSQVFQRCRESQSLAGKAEHVHKRHLIDYGRAVDRFIDIIGDLPAQCIGADEVQDFATRLSKTKAKGQEKPLALSTVRLVMARFSSVLSYAVDIGILKANPVSSSRIHKRLGPAKPKRSLDYDRGYTLPELVQMFSQPEFRALRDAQGRPGNALFWLPLMAAYTGARREEIAQLYEDDVRQDASGCWFIRINDSYPDQSVKTDSSRRVIPIHEDLIALGVLELVRGQHPNERLFPNLVKVSDGFAGIVAKAWRPLTERWGTYRNGRSPLHAFRHTFKSLAREAGIPREVSDWITGHAATNEGDRYGVQPLSRMRAEIHKLPSIARLAGLLP